MRVLLIAVVAWVVLWLFHDTGVLVTGAWLLGATGLALLHRVEARLHYDKQALVLLFLAAAKWLLIDTLLMRAAPDWTPGAAPVLLTAKVLCGIAVAAVLFAAALRIRPPRSAPDPQRSQLPNSTARSLSSICLTASLVALGWLATFEVERLLMLRREVGAAVWPHPAAFVFALTVIWSLVGQLATLVARVLSDAATERAGQVLTFGAAALWLVVGSLAVRASFGAVQVPVLLNGQSIAALVAAATLAALIAQQKQPAQPRFLAAALWSTIGLLGLVTGSLEVDRWATHSLADPDQGRHVGLSIYWALFGIGLVIGGFVRGRHLVRYAGLALLGVTLAKVLLIDTAQIAAAYRIASLLVVGLLLIVTSIAYFKLMPGRGEGGGADRSAGTPSVT